jgi:hypothetical protein
MDEFRVGSDEGRTLGLIVDEMRYLQTQRIGCLPAQLRALSINGSWQYRLESETSIPY